MILKIDPTSWTQLNQLLNEALGLPEEQRQAWIESLSAEHRELKPRLIELLAPRAIVETADFLKTLPKFEDVERAPNGPAAGGEGAVIGPYRLLRELGCGGMGSVWLAERTDGILNRPVALKLPHIAGSRAGLGERMAREREILASLNHPHIATLYDAGVTAEGQPYLALEYVEGIPIDAYCELHALTIRARLRLFVQVASAVAHAHAKLVVHRDLKPSNILVTAQGEVQLLDFGIAKLLEAGVARQTRLTEFSGRAMTPDYASPEQIDGAALTTASDVYSLGVILCELLSGKRPYELKRDSRRALEEAILLAKPARPSDLAAPTDCRALRGDLDTIVHKALKKDPSERYATVDAFAEDVQRFLQGHPVRARPDSTWYRTRRFVKRHRIGVAISATVMVAILGGSGFAITQMLEAQKQRDAALASQRVSRAFGEFLVFLLQDAGDSPKTAKQLLDRGVELLERRPNQDDSTIAAMYYEVASLYLSSNQPDQELALLARSAQISERIGDRDAQAAAECSAAFTLAARDREGAAPRLAAGERALVAVESPSLLTASDCARARARMLAFDGDVPQAIAIVEQSLANIQAAGTNAVNRESLLRAQLTELYMMSGRFKDTLPLTERNLREVRDSGRSGTVTELVAMTNYAVNLMRLGEISRSATVFREAEDTVARSSLGDLTPVGIGAPFAVSLQRMGRNAEALEVANLEIERAKRVGNPMVVAGCQRTIAKALLDLGRVAEARQMLAVSAATLQKLPRFPGQLQDLVAQRAMQEMAEGDLAAAKVTVDTSLEEGGYPENKTAPVIDRTLRAAAAVYLKNGDPAAAESFATDALAFARNIARDERQSADVGLAALLRAEATVALGIRSVAIGDAKLAVEALSNGYGQDHADTERARRLLASIR